MIKKILIWVMVILLIGLFSVGITMSVVANHKCKTMCKQKGTVFFGDILNGKWNFNDACVCYFPEKNKVEVFPIK